MSLTDAEAVRLFLEGDEDAFRVIADRYENRVLTYLTRFYKLAESALDITQETFLIVFHEMTRRPGFKLKAETLEPMILSIAARAAINQLRRESVRGDRPNDLTLFRVADPEEEAIAATITEIELDVRAAMAKLPPDAREVIFLYFICGHTGPEIAKMSNSTLTAVRGRIERARDLLIIHLKAYRKGPDHELQPSADGGARQAADEGTAWLHRSVDATDRGPQGAREAPEAHDVRAGRNMPRG